MILYHLVCINRLGNYLISPYREECAAALVNLTVQYRSQYDPMVIYTLFVGLLLLPLHKCCLRLREYSDIFQPDSKSQNLKVQNQRVLGENKELFQHPGLRIDQLHKALGSREHLNCVTVAVSLYSVLAEAHNDMLSIFSGQAGDLFWTLACALCCCIIELPGQSKYWSNFRYKFHLKKIFMF